MKKPIAIDLFAGGGGLSLGLKRAGFDILGAVDNDSFATQVYKLNHKKTKYWEKDIRLLSPAIIKKELGLKQGELDLLAGCPPCQGFSSLRTMNGAITIHDERNDLIFIFFDFIKALKPKTIMMENVPGLAKDFRFIRFCNSLKKLNYSIRFKIVNVEDYGVPQRRKRLILLASINGRVSFSSPCRKKKTVRNAIGHLARPSQSSDKMHKVNENRSKQVIEIIKQIPKDGGSRKDLDPKYILECHKKTSGFNDVYGRMKWDAPSPTITTGCMNPSKGRFLHPSQNRTITLREAALLQSFPRSYRFPENSSKYAIAKVIGNALPPEFIRRNAVSIIKHLQDLKSC